MNEKTTTQKVVNQKVNDATSSLSFSIYSIAFDVEGDFFNNFVVVFRNLEEKLKQCEDVDLRYMRAVSFIKTAFRAYRDMWQEIHKEKGVIEKLKQADKEVAKITKITYSDAHLVALMLLAGNINLFETISEYLGLIFEKIFEKKTSEYLNIHNKMLFTAMEYYLIMIQVCKHRELTSNSVTVKVFGNNTDIDQQIKEILDASAVLEIEDNSDSL